MTNKSDTVLYTGVTSDLVKRVFEHKACPEQREGTHKSFTKKYRVTKLVYYEIFEDMENAILREKQIKAGSREKKIELIKSLNKDWKDLYEEL